MRKTTEQFINQAKLIHGLKYDYSKVNYVNAKTKVQIICHEHGLFEQTPDKHVNHKCGCPKCAGNAKDDTESFIIKARKVHGDFYNYTLVDYKNNHSNVTIMCPAHGCFEQLPCNHLSGKGCPFCANNVRLSTEEFIAKAIDVHGTKYDYKDVKYNGNRVSVKIICPVHGSFKQVPYAHLSGNGCPVCGNISAHQNRDNVKIYKKTANTFLRKYGTSNPMFNSSIRDKHKRIVSSKTVNDKRVKTKRLNNSFNTSLVEYRLGVLLKSVFGDDDVLHNYVSDLYPFRCDYYIKSRNMYIELNAHWSHGHHWYTDSDKLVIDDWQQKSKYYRNAAQTFSVRDVKKREIARQNSLNYLVFWESDLSDVYKWIDAECPDGQDWDKEYSWLL